METPARHSFTLDGTNRVFPIPSNIKGDNYVRLEVDSVVINDRSKYDIVNNAIVFNNAADVPSGSQLDVLVVQSEEAIGQLGTTSSIDIVAVNISTINDVNDALEDIITAADNIVDIQNAEENAASALASKNAAATSATNANNSATAAATSASNSASSATSASTSATTATTQATAAGTSATNASNSASTASTSASQAASSASTASTKAIQAASSASSASTSATNASNSASSASTSATTATTQAGIATTQAGIATTQASNASSSASNASTSASTATTQATNASNSAASALAIFGNTTVMNDAVASASASALTATTKALEASADAAYIASVQADIITTYHPSVNPTISSDFENQEYKLYEVPSGLSSKALTDIWTVTRGSSATITDACGLDRTVSANVPRITYDVDGRASLLVEEARTNLVTYPNDFKVNVYKKVNSSILPNVTTSPSGNISADKLVEDTTNGAHLVNRTATISVTAGSTQTISCFVKASERTSVNFILASGTYTSQVRCSFDLVTGLAGVISYLGLGSEGDATIQDYGNGWFRCTLSGKTDPSSSIANFNIGLVSGTSTSYVGDGVSGLFLWGCQFEQASTASSFIPDATTFVSRASTATFVGSNGLIQTAAIDTERLSYNPANLNAEPVKLYENAATNLFDHSTNLDSGGKQNATVSTFAGSTPNSIHSAQTLTATLTGSPSGVGNLSSFAVTAGETIWAYGVVKAGTTDDISIVFRGVYSSGFVAGTIDLTTLTRTSGTAIWVVNDIKALNDGWVYIAVSLTSNITASGDVQLRLANGIGAPVIGDSAHVAWFQVTKTPPSSYIPTSGTAVTRAADVTTGVQATRAADIVSRTLGNEFNTQQGSIYFEGTLRGQSGANASTVVTLSDGSTQNRIHIGFNGSSVPLAFIAKNNVAYAQLAIGSSALNQQVKMVLTFSPAGTTFVVNGIVSSDLSVQIPNCTKLHVGRLLDGLNQFNGSINSVKYYPKALSEAEAIALTS